MHMNHMLITALTDSVIHLWVLDLIHWKEPAHESHLFLVGNNLTQQNDLLMNHHFANIIRVLIQKLFGSSIFLSWSSTFVKLPRKWFTLIPLSLSFRSDLWVLHGCSLVLFHYGSLHHLISLKEKTPSLLNEKKSLMFFSSSIVCPVHMLTRHFSWHTHTSARRCSVDCRIKQTHTGTPLKTCNDSFFHPCLASHLRLTLEKR